MILDHQKLVDIYNSYQSGTANYSDSCCEKSGRPWWTCAVLIGVHELTIFTKSWKHAFNSRITKYITKYITEYITKWFLVLIQFPQWIPPAVARLRPQQCSRNWRDPPPLMLVSLHAWPWPNLVSPSAGWALAQHSEVVILSSPKGLKCNALWNQAVPSHLNGSVLLVASHQQQVLTSFVCQHVH